jgi:phospholipase/carboxylesterase
MTDFPLQHSVSPARSGPEPHPALILMHGLGSNEADLMALAPEADPRLFVISVRAPFPYSYGGHMWFDLEEGPGLQGRMIRQSLDALREFIDRAQEEYPIDSPRLYVGGFSQGAAMAGALALLEPETVQGAVMLSGFLPPDSDGEYRADLAAGHPFFQAHGTNDGVVSIVYARMTRDFLQNTPVDLTYREYPMAHQVNLEELMDLRAWMVGVLDRYSVQRSSSSASETP